MVFKTIDALVNLVPDFGYQVGEKLVDTIVRGPDALALLPVPFLGYTVGDALQAGALGYYVGNNNESLGLGIATTVASVIIPPVVRGLRIVYDRK